MANTLTKVLAVLYACVLLKTDLQITVITD